MQLRELKLDGSLHSTTPEERQNISNSTDLLILQNAHYNHIKGGYIHITDSLHYVSYHFTYPFVCRNSLRLGTLEPRQKTTLPNAKYVSKCENRKNLWEVSVSEQVR